MKRLLCGMIIVLGLLNIGLFLLIPLANSKAGALQNVKTEWGAGILVVTRAAVKEDYKRAASDGKVVVPLHPETVGILILAHGIHNHGYGEQVLDAIPRWNAEVLEAVKPLKRKYPLEVAFGMADPETIEDAVRKLEHKNITNVIAVPLFISSHSPIIDNSRYILGLQEELSPASTVKSLPRLKSKMRFTMTEALDDNPLVAEILLERARVLSIYPGQETVILVGHGPNDENTNKLWLNDIEKLASFVREKGGFKEAKAATWRSDAPPSVKEKAAQELRKMVERDGRVIVIPHLLASGGVEGEITEILKGLSYIYNGKTLLPHQNITKWIEIQVEKEIMKLRGNKGEDQSLLPYMF
ncbi:MAG: sirohydrochlorin chelatase [Candidatus Loosdrechtia sp.]|uniref:sirohydrochlorin chelatase n=1 Tax=Candidatus Loosdrechtia sp. TaxID=3101272 RepID=UPI003A6D69D9|nr:MAG: CbiX/SirB N-terminal domain-containing protein [Candidatus Jettenia sp. AMX2]